jgi:hypothetical protein
MQHQEPDALDEAMVARPGDRSFFAGKIIAVGDRATAEIDDAGAGTVRINNGIFFLGKGGEVFKFALGKNAALYRHDTMQLEVGWSRHSQGAEQRTTEVWTVVYKASQPSVRLWAATRAAFEAAVREEVRRALGGN